MATIRPLVSIQNQPIIMYSQQKHQIPTQKLNFSRRKAAIAALASVLVTGNAFAFDFRLVAPDTTLEMAESGIREHAQSLLAIKPLLETESWGEAQKLLRRSSSNLKIDFYTIIQNKPASERPLLRKLYFDLFNNATKLDYAARDKDTSRVWECYKNIVIALHEVLGRI
ncbi:psbQ-like protein 3, chloroplastic [Mercurialis annua]|uniref:psbQ-like protein 3, chloroplastic n=1 Tax=Mercurialis annua TaxID=3986 RepID=UPI002160A369|nr:psbQ-like protein 3, chloroplastic [Mercurialis annua]